MRGRDGARPVALEFVRVGWAPAVFAGDQGGRATAKNVRSASGQALGKVKPTPFKLRNDFLEKGEIGSGAAAKPTDRYFKARHGAEAIGDTPAGLFVLVNGDEGVGIDLTGNETKKRRASRFRSCTRTT